jgi:hypothetical protein
LRRNNNDKEAARKGGLKNALLISCFDWYAARLEPIRELLTGEGYEVTVLTSDFDHIKKKELETRHEACTYLHVPQYKKNISLRRVFSHLVFGRKVGGMLNRLRPDLIYLLLPPNNTARYCLRYKKRHPDTRYIVDIIDMWPESMPLGKIKDTLPARLWARLRDDSLASADYVFTECGLYQEKLKDKLNKDRTSVLYLYKKQSGGERQLAEDALRGKQTRPKSSRLSLAYLGSMNNIIDIEGICGIAAALIAAGYDVDLRAVGDGESRDAFLNAVKNTGCALHYSGAVFDPLQKIKILGQCDFGLNMMKCSISVGLTIKSIDYLSMGLPLINNIPGDTWELVEKYGIGINAGGNVPVSEAASAITSMDLTTLSRNALECFERMFTPCAFRDAVKNGLFGS